MKKDKIKYKGKVKNKNYLSNPDWIQSYMILNNEKIEEILSPSLIENSEEQINLNANSPLGNKSMDAKFTNRKKREGD
ncbi:MAG: hypothetical protein ACFE85_15405 [Candidatus Hodarchaeota archaeon]